jgi:hypothetical protein
MEEQQHHQDTDSLHQVYVKADPSEAAEYREHQHIAARQ